MQHFHYQNNELYAEAVKLSDVVQQFSTPLYVYSEACLENNWQAFENALQGVNHLLCYAVKANSNLAILNFFAKKGAGFDIVSEGELVRVLKAGGDPKKIVFSGVGKREIEIKSALEANVGCFNVESVEELNRIESIAKQLQKIAPVSLRLNPDIDPKTHPYIATGLSSNKFGIEYTHAFALCSKIKNSSQLKLVGIDCHIGSQLTELTPFLEALDRLLECYETLNEAGIQIEHINMGGGLGVKYQNENPPTIQQYVTAIKEKIQKYPVKLILEPGRIFLANSGLLLTRVEYIKKTAHKNFAIVDAGMNDLMRPALYSAWHDIIPLNIHHAQGLLFDIVGPVCESADFLGKDRSLALESGDYLAICSAGAYGSSMASNYNSRPKPAEIFIQGEKFSVIRAREEITDLFKNECFPPEH